MVHTGENRCSTIIHCQHCTTIKCICNYQIKWGAVAPLKWQVFLLTSKCFTSHISVEWSCVKVPTMCGLKMLSNSAPNPDAHADKMKLNLLVFSCLGLVTLLQLCNLLLWFVVVLWYCYIPIGLYILLFVWSQMLKSKRAQPKGPTNCYPMRA